jgi:chromosome condensin MukBEF ATPase and DNA-binding subunit MukB
VCPDGKGLTILGAEPHLDPLDFDFNQLSTPSDDSEPAVNRPKTSPSDPIEVVKEEGDNVNDTPEEAARVAAEEDKRRRNTLASARFRAKKKLREQALEKDHKEMSTKIERLENRIKELELENKWLRGLVVQSKQASS